MTTKLVPGSCTQMQMALFVCTCSAALALCDDPVDIDNGTVTFTGNLVGDVATYTCDLGFELFGDTTVTCTLMHMYSAEFQPAPPSCRREYTE